MEHSRKTTSEVLNTEAPEEASRADRWGKRPKTKSKSEKTSIAEFLDEIATEWVD